MVKGGTLELKGNWAQPSDRAQCPDFSEAVPGGVFGALEAGGQGAADKMCGVMSLSLQQRGAVDVLVGSWAYSSHKDSPWRVGGWRECTGAACDSGIVNSVWKLPKGGSCESSGAL